jgi:hypothetical protein
LRENKIFYSHVESIGAEMARTKKTPKLRIYRGKYYCTDIYLPDGKRSTVGFGTTDEHTAGDIYTAFGKWLKLYSEQSYKVLTEKHIQ